MKQEQKNLALAVASVRQTLRSVLAPLQEQALAAGNDEDLSAKMLQLAERTAAAMGALYEVEQHPDRDRAWLSGQMTTVMEQLRNLLTSAQLLLVDVPNLEPLVSMIASALAGVFPLAASFNFLSETPTDRPADPRPSREQRSQRVKKRLQLVLDPSDPPPARVSQPPESIPLVRLAQVLQEAQTVPSTDSAQASPPLSSLPETEQSEASVPSGPVSSRREAERTELEVEIGFVSESHFYTGISMDISTGGLFIATYQLMEVGTEVDLSLVLPGGRAIKAVGVVRWLRDTTNSDSDVVPGMGIAFQSLDEQDKRAIERFCELRAPIYFDQ